MANKGAKGLRVVVTLACICLWIAFFTSTVSFFSPAWITMETPKSKAHIGLVVFCRYSAEEQLHLRDNCTWFESGDTEPQGWMIATRGLLGSSCTLMFLTVLSFLFLCGAKFQNPECSSFIIAGNFLAFVALTCAVVTFGIKAAEEFDAEFVDRKGYVFLDWGYYLSIIGAGFSLFSLIIISTAVYYTSADNTVVHHNGNYLYMEQKS